MIKLQAFSSIVILCLMAAAPAMACGGLFCSTAGGPAQPPAPVDQSAERIVFEVDRNANTITAHVQISYAGSPDAFAWVIPVPAVPEVSESSMDFIQMLDNATQIQVTAPPQEPCDQPNFGNAEDDSFGCTDSSFPASAPPTGFPEGFGKDEDGPVTVYAQDVTDNFEFVVIGAERTEDLIEFLQENNYNVSDNMTPVMTPYNAPTMKFLALKLRSDRNVNDIVPIKMTYTPEEGPLEPMIPLKLTAVAAQPLMGILVFILADEPYTPKNFGALIPEPRDFLLDTSLRSNYFDVVARKVDFAEGRAFFTEFVGDNPIRNQRAGDEIADEAMISRFYARISPHQMTADPVFTRADLGFRQPATLNLSHLAPLLRCGQPIPERAPSACAFNYCGSGARCTVVDNQVGCLCAEDQVAQTVTGPTGLPSVTCTPRQNPFGITDEAAGVGTEVDPCNNLDCGSGTCVVKGGFPTCECDEGAVACLEPNNVVRCVPAPSDVQTFGPGAGPESSGATAALQRRERPLNDPSRVVGALFPLLIAIVFPLWWRRRL